ncbi:MAG TPA: inositol monophosphatase family protein [Vicinamibacteria bacterium]|nr:inositol monophosphatase family protein [Vicinamibacteria bacterium]
MPGDLGRALEVAIAAVRHAGDVLRQDLHRPGGPRGAGDKAEADTEAEHLCRRLLTEAFPGWGYLGEETGAAAGQAGAPVWLVDPNDGTRDYLQGRRGSAVSIGLVRDGVPRLGVVFSFAYPDDAGDLFAWAEGCGPLTRNGRALPARLPAALGALDVVLLSSAADRRLEGNLACVAPARCRTLPSIAHRLALVAAGEAVAAVSLNQPGAWDYGGGHALLRGAGAHLVDEAGREMSYRADGASHCRNAFGGSAGVVRTLASRDWGGVLTAASGEPLPEGFPVRLRPGEAESDAGRLSRAQGCLLGQVAGDSLGSLVEFRSAAAIAAAAANGPRRLVDGGEVWDLLAGQPTDDSEMALAMARSVLARDGYHREAVRAAFSAWLQSRPFDVGSTVGGALRGRPHPDSQANGALMRASPLGVLAHARPPAEAAALAREDAGLTHVHQACLDASAAFVVAIAHAVCHGDGAEAAWRAAHDWAVAEPATPLVVEALEAAREAPPVCDGPRAGWVRIALQNAFHELLHAASLEEGVVATVRRGGDTDTNAAIAGALLGAVHGRPAVPEQWRAMVLSCRPTASRARRPRPHACWPVDVLEIAERLLLVGAPRRSGGRNQEEPWREP